MIKQIKKARYIPNNIQSILWGIAAGRCEITGCNQILWKSPLTHEKLKLAEMGHIYSFSCDGPRGNNKIDYKDINSISNLILVCPACHKLIDSDVKGTTYSASRLQHEKILHEERVKRVTSINPNLKSYILHYFVNIKDHSFPFAFCSTASALIPDRFPADDKEIDLSIINSSFQEFNNGYWDFYTHDLVSKYDQRVRERLSSGEIQHLSVFALAPQPLLIKLGTLVSDIVPTDIYQLNREPQTWIWPENGLSIPFKISKPKKNMPIPALVLSLSATIEDDRIETVLGKDISIWNICIDHPQNDFVKSKKQLSEFRKIIRDTLNQIKSSHGQKTTLHVFSAAPTSISIELGRIRMPKADMPWQIYDQNNQLGGFSSALKIE